MYLCLRSAIAVPKAEQVKSNKRQQATYPDRKISETFLDFAAPLLATMPDDATEARVEKVLSIAFAVWNGIVLDGVNGNESYMTKVREQASTNPSPRPWWQNSRSVSVPCSGMTRGLSASTRSHANTAS